MPPLVEPARSAGFLRAIAQPELEVDDGLALRPWHESDVPAVLRAFACPDIQRWHVRRMDTHDEALDWTASWQTRWDDEEDASWAVVHRGDDQALGQVGLRGISLAEGLAHLSYWVLPAARGAGLAVRATQALTRWTFDVLGLHRIGLEHSTANAASCRVATKLGFEVDGTLRGSARHADGWHDMHVHSRLRTDRRPGG